MTAPRIGIIGGGPGGLTVARILHLGGIKATVFEGEALSSARPQGWSLDLHPETGQYALEQAGLMEEFKRIARYEDQETRVYDKGGALLFQDGDGATGDRPEVDRGHLRRLLLDSLPEGIVRWDHKLSATPVMQGDGSLELVFRNGVRDRFDLVIGADGAWSRLRPLLSEAQPLYSGVTFFELGMADVDRKHPEIAALVGHGLMFALGDQKALIAHRDADAHVGFYAGLRVPEDWLRGGALDLSSGETIRFGLLQLFEGWSQELRRLLHEADDAVTPRQIFALPVGHRWEHRKGVTLLGDAAHLMSPFSGEGANLAMRDGADLALALAAAVTSGSSWDEAVRSYEEMMFARAAEAATGAKAGIEGAFAEDGLAHTVAQMRTHRE